MYDSTFALLQGVIKRNQKLDERYNLIHVRAKDKATAELYRDAILYFLSHSPKLREQLLPDTSFLGLEKIYKRFIKIQIGTERGGALLPFEESGESRLVKAIQKISGLFSPPLFPNKAEFELLEAKQRRAGGGISLLESMITVPEEQLKNANKAKKIFEKIENETSFKGK